MVIKNSIPERLELNSVREGVQVKKKQLTMLHMQHIITFIILANIFIWSKDVSMKTKCNISIYSEVKTTWRYKTSVISICFSFLWNQNDHDWLSAGQVQGAGWKTEAMNRNMLVVVVVVVIYVCTRSI